jgi:hypothetical protein
VVFGMTDRDSSLLKRHATPEVVDCQKEAHVVRDVDRVHLIAFIELEELHRIVLKEIFFFIFLRMSSMFMWWSSSSSLLTSSMPTKI